MKRLVFVVTVALLATAILSVGCTKATPPATKAPPENVTGVLKDVNTPAEPGKDTVTVQTPQGAQTLPITATTAFSVGGKACTLDELDALNTTNASYNCTVVLDVDGIVVGVDVTKTMP